MKSIASVAKLSGALCLGGLLVASAAFADETDHNLYWDPTGSNTTSTGGMGTWNTSVANSWYTGVGTTRHQWVTGTSGTIATYYNLYFGGAEQTSAYTVTTNLSNTLLSTGTLSLFFQGDYILTRDTTATNVSLIGGSTATTYLGVVVNPDKTLRLVAGTDANGSNRITLQSSANSSINPAMVFTGGGTVELSAYTTAQLTSGNGHLRIGAAGSAATLAVKPNGTVTAGRIMVANGTLNVDGGTVNLSNSSSARGNSALFIGSNGAAGEEIAPSVVNLNSGTLNALPSVHVSNGLLYGQGRHGIAFAVDPFVLTADAATTSTGLAGGTFHLNGGTLTTTNIYANPFADGTVTARFVFNGGSLVIAAGATQDQLDHFISGFQNTDANHVEITSAGVVINTGTIDTVNTNGRATISSGLRGAGSLTKTGANTLGLTGINTYSGGTIVSAGTLEGTTSGLQGAITNNASLIFDQNNDGTFSGVISGSGTLAKAGTGTVTLAGTHTFAGGTHVAEGILRVDGQVVSPVVVSGGALSGSGRIASSVSIAAAGRLAVTLPAGTATLTPLTIDQELSFAEGATLEVSGTDVPGGNTWTLVTAGSFTGPLPQLVLPEGWQGSLAVVGQELRFTLDPFTTATQAWRELNFGSTEITEFSAATADPDQDGWTNLVEYALGLDPLEPDGVAALTQGIEDGYLTLTFNSRATPDLTYSVEAADTLGTTWSSIWTRSSDQNTDGPVKVVDTVPVNSRPARFLRLHVETAAW